MTQAELDQHWQHASPTGGFVASEWRNANTFAAGQVIRVDGRWWVLESVTRFSQYGMTRAWLGQGSGYRLFTIGDGAEVRTDIPNERTNP